nr:ChaN family lipoprotein [Geomonas sp. Red32]
MGDRTPVPLDRVVEEIAPADAVFLGDTHDDRSLHAKQLEIIKALYAKNPRLAIGLEMFTIDSQSALDGWTSGKLSESEFLPIYAKNWSYPWELYRDIFLFARDNKIPIIALNVPKAAIGKVVRAGAGALTGSDLAGLPPGPWSLSPRQAEYLRLIRQQAFANLPPRFPSANFDQAQALRNHTMASFVMRYLERTPGSQVVVIAGTWHSIRNGVPDSMKRYGKVDARVILQDLVEFTWLKPTAEDADFLILRDR